MLYLSCITNSYQGYENLQVRDCNLVNSAGEVEEQHKTIGMFVEGGSGLVHSQLLGGKSNKGMNKTRIRKGIHIDTALGLREELY